MYHIAIVEDETEYANEIQDFLQKYQEENDVRFKISVYRDGAEIVENYEAIYDLILLDIEMPKLNGMEAAEKIREKDEEVVLMFITNVATYAIRGYEVGALDFVMKPVNYYTFSMKITRALKRVKQKEQHSILINLLDGVKRLEIQQIYYIEVQNRMLHYYTTEGEYVVRGTMQSVEQALAPYSFVKCNHWYMVNLRHVREVRKNTVVVGKTELEISRRNKTPFLKELTDYVGGMQSWKG